MTVRVAELRIHPLKSGAILPVASAAVTPAGLRGDRRWMVVDADGECVTARTDRLLFALTAVPGPQDSLRLTSRSGPTMTVCRPAGPLLDVTVHGRPVRGREADEAAQAFVRGHLRRPDVRLVWCPPGAERALNPAYSAEGDHTAYADGYPVTLASRTSLRQVSEWAGEEVAMDRFRPNVVIDGEPGELAAFAEEGWGRVEIGEVGFEVAKGVDRCSMTLLDPTTLLTGKEPIRTLSRHRKRDGATWFCVHLIPERPGPVDLGDPVVGFPR